MIVTEVFSFTVKKNCGLLRHVVWFLQDEKKQKQPMHKVNNTSGNLL